MELVLQWTGRHAAALQRALRDTNESFAERLGVAVRTVAAWNADPGIVPRSEMQAALDTALEQAPEAARKRFALRLDAAPAPAVEPPAEGAEVVPALVAEVALLQARVDHLQEQLARLTGVSL
ncbi:hypothetical protein [Streptomyces sp. DH37]|uniref:hypothetical protein n=1 Tax=Streptomyces sp. DH37 TaxID=3040122 RepID=UPI00244106C3|nr:hypothetical protein [Streptomyces sp. DH37]MDG9706268.1 hypothetical protein [Streptomyces sp. DH37]